jgi:hypothetical protein
LRASPSAAGSPARTRAAPGCLRGVDSRNLPYFLKIFTWKSAEIPDHAPAEVRAIWQELENACEKRHARPGIDFTEVTAVAVN